MRDHVTWKHREVHDVNQDAVDTEVSTEEFDVVRSFFSISTTYNE